MRGIAVGGSASKEWLGLLSLALLLAPAPAVASAARTLKSARSAAAPAKSTAAATATALSWEGWSEDLFARAKRENRFVLLDLEAVWCHWCHVMAETTYRDPTVVSLLRSRYLTVRVDQDSRPDLASRYEDYGWPATVVFNPDGAEIVKLQGYVPPKRMASLLQAIIADPSPGPSVLSAPDPDVSAPGALSAALQAELEKLFVSRYDPKLGGWGGTHKYLDGDSVEYCLVRARADGNDGNADAKRMALQTLQAQLKLMDPVWGGVYQYSDSGDWDHPHFEKIMAMQAENLRLYSLAYAQWRDPVYLETARAIHRYLAGFLRSPEGAFYTSQDADLVPGEHSAEYYRLGDAERRARGVPRIDTHSYTRENGWVVRGLVALYAVTGDEGVLAEAVKATRWVVEHRALAGGGFSHDASDPAGPYLGDNLAIGRAFLDLYGATADREWLKRAEASAAYIEQHFRVRGSAGYVTATPSAGLMHPRPQREENVALARFANLLRHYTGDLAYRKIAETAMGYATIPEVARRFNAGGVLLAGRELGSEPVHVTVVGAKKDPAARELFVTALAYPADYRRIEWWDKAQGKLANPDVAYPDLEAAAAFTCANGRCSLPVFKRDKLLATFERFGR